MSKNSNSENDIEGSVIEKTEPIKYETLPSQPIPEEAVLDEDKVFIPQTSKQTEVIEEEVDVAVNRIVEILKSEIKVL